MAKLTPITIDFETFWSDKHSLSKMSPIEYIMHPETEVISLAYKFAEDRSHVIVGEDRVREWIAQVDWSDKLVIAHNGAGFDHPLLAWRFGVKPGMWADTLCMARPLHAKDVGGSLAALVKHYNLGVKDQAVLIQTKGRHLKDFTPEEVERMRKYNADDTDQCWGLFKKLLPCTNNKEMRLIDMTTRMLTEPKFELDTELLEKTLAEERAAKHKSLVDLAKMFPELREHINALDDATIAETVATVLGSSAKFSALLTSMNVEVPTKISPTTGKTTPALAKTDEAFIALQEHDNPMVSAAARARVGVKSTLLESRIEAFLAAARAVGGKLPVPLKYYGADTTGRWSGWAYNPQNLPRVSGKRSDALRNSLRAPAGKKVIVADLSGIELRVNHFLWKVPSSMALYQADPEKADLYKDFASNLYEISPEEVSKAQRQVGKVAHLGLGFGAGAVTFQKVAKLMGGVDISLEEARLIVERWRSTYPEIASGWKTCHGALDAIVRGYDYEIDPWGMCVACDEGISTPVGMIRYPNLRREMGEDGKSEWFYGEGRNKARIYAGKIDENIVQHLARNVIADNAIQFHRETGLVPQLTVHDELVYVVDEAKAEELLALLQRIMRTPPAWWPELVTWSEGDVAYTYGAAK